MGPRRAAIGLVSPPSSRGRSRVRRAIGRQRTWFARPSPGRALTRAWSTASRVPTSSSRLAGVWTRTAISVSGMAGDYAAEFRRVSGS